MNHIEDFSIICNSVSNMHTLKIEESQPTKKSEQLFDSKERVILDTLAKNNKFPVPSPVIKLVYATSIQRMDYFLKCFRFIMRVKNNLKYQSDNYDASLIYKVKDLVNDYLSLAHDFELLRLKYDRPIAFGKSNILRKIDLLLLNNEDKVNKLIDLTATIGHESKTFNVNEQVGYT